MIHIINSTDINIQPTDSSPDMRALQDTTILPRNQWPDQQSGNSNGSYLSGNSCLTCYNTSLKPVVTYDPLGGHNIWQVILIVFFTGLLSLVTIIGNILVLVSFKVNKQLKTVNNYFLLSLAFADLIIGVSSMNLYTTYIIMDKWALGSWACDLWLAIDYVASNASVMNLLVISFDRYFSITRPLTYRAKRTTKRAGIMIGLAWAISFVLWAPAILFWQYFVGVRTVPHDKCYIQFLSEPIITFCTAIAAFYLPVTIMTVLYWRIYKETENRSKELACLQATGSEAETAQFVQQTGSSRSCGSFEVCRTSRRKSVGKDASRFYFWPISRSWKLDSSSDSWNNDTGISADQSGSSDEEEMAGSHAIFSIILNFPGIKAVGSSRFTCQEEPEASEMDPLKAEKPVKNREEGNKTDSDTPQQHFSKIGGGTDTIASKTSSISSSFKEAVLFKRCTARTRTQITKRKRMSLVKEKKAAQTLSAILLAFIITWTPYNIMVLINTFCNNCIPESLWALGYWLCYVNSTVNPMCYALCNKTFRTTFKMILLCRWDSWSRNNQKFQRPAVVFHRRISEEPP